MTEFNATQYKNEFQAKNYDRVSVVIPKEDKKKLQEKAREENKSLNEFIMEAVYEKAGLQVPEKKPKGRKKKETDPGVISAETPESDTE